MSNERPNTSPARRITFTASAVTSLPIPSPGMTAIRSPMSQLLPLCPFDRERHTHAAAHAQRREAALRVAAHHLVEQRNDDPRTRAPDWMPERDRAAVDVEFLHRDRQVLQHSEDLRCKRFVQLDQVEIVE